MRTNAILATLFGVLILPLLFAVPANAQATRTWVSGVGDDANPCSRTAPCKTFPGAISKTAAGGEINVLDPGGFGAVTITKSITIDGSGGSIAGILVSGTNGITVNDGGAGTITVTLRNLDIEGLGLTGSVSGIRGISFVSGAVLNVQNCTIRNFRDATNGTGISFTPSGAAKLEVVNTIITGNGNGSAGGGIVIQPTGTGSVLGSLKGVSVDNNSNNGLLVSSASVTGGNGSIVTVVDSNFTGNSVGVAATANAGTAAIRIMFDDVNISNNSTTGVSASSTGAAMVGIFLGNTTIFRNGVGVQIVSPAVIGTYTDNKINGNLTTDVSGALTTFAKK